MQEQVPFMEENLHVMSYTSAILIDKDGKELTKRVVKNNSGSIFGNLLRHYEITMQSVLVKKSILEENNFNFDTSLKYNPDYNLFMNIASRFPVGVIKEPLSKYRILDDSLSKKTIAIAAREIKHTLDQLSNSSDSLKKKYHRDFIKSYDKLHYYEMVSAIYQQNRRQAMKEIDQSSSPEEYFILYILLLIFSHLR